MIDSVNRSGQGYVSNRVFINDGYKYNSNSLRHSYGMIDDIVLISGSSIWTSNFIPPKMYLKSYLRHNGIIENDNDYYGKPLNT